MAPSAEETDTRPDFLVRMGILLPCSVADVEAAYRERAKEAHPDRGGSAEAFLQLQSDYEQAREFASFQGSRRRWLAASIERYVDQQRVVEMIERHGGRCEIESIEWMRREIGEDFAQVLDKVVGITLQGPEIDIAAIQYLVRHADALGSLRSLDLAGARIGRSSIELLEAFPALQELNLSGTFVNNSALPYLARLPALERVDLSHTFVGPLGRFRLRQMRPGLQFFTASDAARTGRESRRNYRLVFRLVVLYLLAVGVATHMPLKGVELPEITPWFGPDKLVHFAIYGGMAYLMALVLSLRDPDRAERRLGMKWYLYVVVLTLIGVIGAIDERTQPLTGRSCELADWLADLAGGAVGLLGFAVTHWLFRKPSKRRRRTEAA